jgi:hypothetical protein
VPVITITRGSLSASQKLTDRLSREIGCRSISREDIIEHGKRYGIEEFMRAAESIMEKNPPHSWDPHAAQIHNYLAIFKAALMDFVVGGDVIYHGLQTHFLLTDVPRILRLKVVAPMEYRVRVLMKEMNLTEPEAREHINHVDGQRIRWAKFLYGPEFDEPTSYDMTLNMCNLNLDAMVELVALVIRRPEFRIDGGAMKKLRDAHLKAFVIAHLVRSQDTREMEMSVDCDSDTGWVKVRRISMAPAKSEWKELIEKSLQGLSNISTIEIE